MVSKDRTQITETAVVTPIGTEEFPEGMRMELWPEKQAEQEKRNEKIFAMKGEGKWVPVHVAEGGARHVHEEIWVEHHGHKNGSWQKGQLYRWEEAT